MSTENSKISKLKATRPKAITHELEVLEYAAHIPVEEAVNALIEKQYVLIVDAFSSGLVVIEALKKRLSRIKKEQSFAEQRSNRNLFRTLSHHLLLEVSNHKLVVRKAPQIGWLKELYPEQNDFFLPFPEVQGLNSSWQWQEKGIHIPQLKRKINPYYGTYFPTRFEHIELFDKFLSGYTGSKKQAVDVGIGSGVLSLLLQKYDFESIIGTDTNPNALIGVQKMLGEGESTITLRSGDLFANSNRSFDLIVFNPPWIPMKQKSKGIDAAIYYDDQLFTRFFNQAEGYLKENGKLVLIFSNLAKLMDEKAVHPIAHELKVNQRFKKVDLLTLKVKPQSDKTKRVAQWRDEEVVELWVLELRN